MAVSWLLLWMVGTAFVAVAVAGMIYILWYCRPRSEVRGFQVLPPSSPPVARRVDEKERRMEE